MKSKEELIKQVVILGIILLVVIIMAVVLNAGKGNKEVPEIKVQNSQTQNTNSNNSKDEMMENLKGLLEPTTKNEYQDSGTIKQPLETGIKEELKTVNNEIIQYEEIWNGDN